MPKMPLTAGFYAVLLAFILGGIFTSGIFVFFTYSYNGLSLYISSLALFHFLEYLCIAKVSREVSLEGLSELSLLIVLNLIFRLFIGS